MAHPHNDKTREALLVKPLWAGIITFLLLASVCAYLTYQRYMIVRNEDRQNAMNIAESARSRLQQALQYSFSATQAMTLLIDKNGQVNNFDSIAPLIYKAHKYIDALQLVPGGVIKYVYPLEGNEAVIDYDILNDPARNKEAYKAIEKKEIFFGGPFKLKQGGIGIVGRLPVFSNDKPWGFSAVVIRLSTLLNAAGIDSAGKSGYYFQLSKINPDTRAEEFFLPFRGHTSTHFEEAVTIPNGDWTLSVMPVNGYKSLQDVLILIFLGLVLSLLGASFAYYYSKTPEYLQKLVAERTAELDKSEKRNKTIVNALPDMVFIVNNEGRIVDFNNSAGHETLMEPGQFMMKKIAEVLPEPVAADLMSYVNKVLQTGQIFSYSYQLTVRDEIRSYESRLVPHRADDVLVLVRDTTEAKKVEKELIQSREELRRLSNYLEDVREEERLHIAREIHDELGQHLTVLKMNFSFLEKNLLASDLQYATELNKINNLIIEMVTAVRKISHELRPAILDQLGLVAAIEWYGNDFEKKTGIKTSFITDFPEKDLPEKLKIGLFRIFQESLTNVARHAAASRVDASLHLQEGDLVLLIEDNGKGFNTDAIDHRKTLGILGMKERAIVMGGIYNIHSTPGRGTIIDVVVPFSNN
jgi:PAS domain S-box-containing protein